MASMLSLVHMACIDVKDDQGDHHCCRYRMNDRSEADHRNREQEREIGAPDNDAGQDEQQHAGHQQPEQELLTAVELARFRHVPVITIHHFADMAQPFPVGRRQDIQLPVIEKHDCRRNSHHHPDEGMEDACPDAAAKQLAQREEGGMKEHEAGQCQQDESYCCQPVVGPLGWRISVLVFPDHFSSLNSFSISSETSLGPLVT